MADEKIPLVYKGHPLRRKDNLIYYGSMADKYIIAIQILSSQKEGDLKSRDRVVKKSEKANLYDAMDVGAIWLERALSGK